MGRGDFTVTRKYVMCGESYYGLGSVRTPIALHCGSLIFNMAVKAQEIARF